MISDELCNVFIDMTNASKCTHWNMGIRRLFLTNKASYKYLDKIKKLNKCSECMYINLCYLCQCSGTFTCYLYKPPPDKYKNSIFTSILYTKVDIHLLGRNHPYFQNVTYSWEQSSNYIK